MTAANKKAPPEETQDLSLLHVALGDGCVVIKDIDVPRQGGVVIPETINDLPVRRVSIRAGKHRHQKRFRSIDFPAGVQELTISPGVTVSRVRFSRGSDTFWTDGKAIYSCDRTQLIRVASPSLTSYTVQEGTVSAADYAFSGCKKLTRIELPTSFRLLRPLALRGLAGYLIIVGGENLTEPEPGYFERLEKACEWQDYCLTILGVLGHTLMHTLPKNGSIVVPEGVETIAKNAFYLCFGVTELRLPSTLVEPGENTLDNWRFETIHVAPGNRAFRDIDGVLFSADGRRLLRVPMAYSGPEYRVPDGVTEIADRAMKECRKIQSLIIPDSVTKIGEYACSEMRTLTRVRLPRELSELPDGLFYECSGLIDVRLPETLRSLGKECFVNCPRVSFSLPETLEEIGDRAFMRQEIKPGKIALPASVRTVGIGAFAGWAEVEVTESEDISGLGRSQAGQITVRSASTGKILYRVPLRVNGQSPELCEMLGDCFMGGTQYDFVRMDKLFSRIRGVEARFRVALTRLAWPEGLTQESREMYVGYVRKMGMKIATACIENGDLEGLRAAAEFGAVKRANVDKLVEAAANAGRTELTAFLLDFKNKSL